MAQKGLWNLAKEKIMKERGELPYEEGDVVRECQAVNEENFWSTWLWEDERGKEERTAKAEKNEEEKGEKRKREVEKEENEPETVKRRCEGFVSVEAYEICGQGEIWRVTRIFVGKTPWRSLRAGLVVHLIRVRVCVGD